MTLIEKIKEMKNEINSLKKDVAELKQKVRQHQIELKPGMNVNLR